MLGASVAHADVPTAVNYQGTLYEQNAPANGAYDIQFALYADESSGTALAAIDVPDVSVEQGTFLVDIGELFAAAPSARFIEVSVKRPEDAEYDTLPRVRLGSVPFALRAGVADAVDWSGVTNKPQSLAGETGANGALGPQGPAGALGPQGPAGADGAAGLQGLAGADGAAGLQGLAGALGPQGPAGADGAAGPEGLAGLNGKPGQSVIATALDIGDTDCPDGGVLVTSGLKETRLCNGEVGAPGLAGESVVGLTLDVGDEHCDAGGLQVSVGAVTTYLCNGLDGSPGPAGKDGNPGKNGPQGPQGLAGNEGAVGPEGPQGPVGNDGPAGKDGNPGKNGSEGPQGIAGKDGAVGSQGPAGLNGLDGAVGPLGPQGPAGLNGLDGAVGPMGPQGPAGLNGLDGAMGPMGPQGPAGNDGVQGPEGVQGELGPKGTDGISGTSGIVATASFSGFIASLFGGSDNYEFAGGIVNATTSVGQRLTAAASGSMGLAIETAPIQAFVDICYRDVLGGPMLPFAGNNATLYRFASETGTYAAAGSVLPGAGNWIVGLCVKNPSSTSIKENDFANGWVQVTN